MGIFNSRAIINRGDIIVGIDFGTSGLAFAYGIFDDQKVPPRFFWKSNR